MIGNNWDFVLKDEYSKEYFISLMKFIDNEYKNKTIYPKREDIFRALKLTDYDSVKVVIIGQDPYHGKGEANGLCFSVNNDVITPPSLRNIFNELKSDLGITRSDSDLTDWACEGVLLLNSILTVLEDNAFSHKNKGWEIFIDRIIMEINKKDTPVVFVLWGNSARSKKKLITNKLHCVIESAHPSPLSYNRGFKGSKPFSKVNEFLKKSNLEEIKW